MANISAGNTKFQVNSRSDKLSDKKKLIDLTMLVNCTGKGFAS